MAEDSIGGAQSSWVSPMFRRASKQEKDPRRSRNLEANEEPSRGWGGVRRSIVYPRKSQLWDSIFKHKRDTSNSLDHLNHVTENREHAAQREKEIKGRVHGLVLMLDQRVPLDELAKLIFELEQADIHDLELIQAAKSKLVRARDAQEKRRQQELKAERERLYKAAVLELKQQLTLEPLDVDVDALRHQLDIGKTIDMQSKDEELFAKATDKLHLAARLQQEVRDAKKRQAEAELKLQTMLTATLGLPALTEALSDGQRVEASKELLDEVEALIRMVRSRDEILVQLRGLLEQPLVEVGHDALHEAAVEGIKASVPVDTIRRANAKLREAEQLQEPHQHNAQRLDRFISSKTPVAEIDMSELRKARDLVAESGHVLAKMGARFEKKHHPEAMLQQAQEKLIEAEGVQGPIVVHIGTLLVTARPLMRNTKEVAAAKAALKSAEKAGNVPSDILELVRNRIADGETLSRSKDSRTESSKQLAVRRAVEYGTQICSAAQEKRALCEKQLAELQKKLADEAANLKQLSSSLELELGRATKAEELLLKEEERFVQLVRSSSSPDGPAVPMDERLRSLTDDDKHNATMKARDAVRKAREAIVLLQRASYESRRQLAAYRGEEEQLGVTAVAAKRQVDWSSELIQVAQMELLTNSLESPPTRELASQSAVVLTPNASERISYPSPPPSPPTTSSEGGFDVHMVPPLGDMVASPPPSAPTSGRAEKGAGRGGCCGKKAAEDVIDPTPQAPQRAIVQQGTPAMGEVVSPSGQSIPILKQPSESNSKPSMDKQPSDSKLGMNKQPSASKLDMNKQPSNSELSMNKQPSNSKLSMNKQPSNSKLSVNKQPSNSRISMRKQPSNPLIKQPSEGSMRRKARPDTPSPKTTTTLLPTPGSANSGMGSLPLREEASGSFELVDLFCWVPLTLGVVHIPGLLLEVAHTGGFAIPAVVRAVARACREIDSQMAGRFVKLLAESFFAEPTQAMAGRRASVSIEERGWNKQLLAKKHGAAQLSSDGMALIIENWVAEISKGGEHTHVLIDALEYFVMVYPEGAAFDFCSLLKVLLAQHRPLDAEGSEPPPPSITPLTRCFQLVLSSAVMTPDLFQRMVPIWSEESEESDPALALRRTATSLGQLLDDHESVYLDRRNRGQLEWDDKVLERAILALVGLFVADSSKLLAFQQLVPQVFDVYLAQGTRLRNEMCRELARGGMDKGVVSRISDDDELARQRFFWSAAGVMLFGHPELLQNPVEVKRMLDDALKQQPSIVASFIAEACDKAAIDDASEATLDVIVELSLKALLEHASAVGLDSMTRPMALATERILEASTRHYNKVYECALRAWEGSSLSSQVLKRFCEEYKNRLDGGGDFSARTIERTEYVIQALAKLFVHNPEEFDAFSKLVPEVFQTRLRLGSEARRRINTLLMAHAFEPTLEGLIANSDEFVSSPYFWNSKVMPLFTEVVTHRDYPTLHKTSLTMADGSTIMLYPKLLALLLRIASGGGAEPSEIARRTKEVLDQFERNEDQQKFLLTIFDTLESRSRSNPELFQDIQLTLLGDVAQNGVQTLSSVKGEGLLLCEQAMTTLLQTYITQRNPDEWKFLFKEATNISFMVKYMFRENLELARTLFRKEANNKENYQNVAEPAKVQEMMIELVETAMAEYGNVGIYDPMRLAEIDFINQPQLLVDLVQESNQRRSRKGKDEMGLMTNITATWMEHMVERGFPPLSPHHTQAFTVLMAAKFFNLHLSEADRKTGQRHTKRSLRLKSFVAQLATGEGKSIVIAMLAIFIVKLYGMKVHVLENNAGLLERDFATNKPFYDKFEIKSATKLDEPDVQICYCLKAAINTRFLRKMIEGTLDEELGNTVLIVDEVDDLIINEWPNAHYVRKDSEQTPALAKSFAVLKKGENTKPAGVPQEVWEEASADVAFCNQHVREGKHYRIMTDGEKKKVFMLDKDGNLPKVPLTSPWLQYMNYKHCSIKPSAQSRHACVCTPYIFQKYKGIFGLTASVGGKAELDYLTKTYKAVKFDVPRFLDTCVGDARKDVINHGVELMEDDKALASRVVEIARSHFRKVPVLIISSSLAELAKLHAALQGDADIPSSEVQRFSEFDGKGRSLKKEWQTIIDDATKRLGSKEDNHCRITVTDSFGGRGHDFQVVDKEANANGGMLVIATSIPDKREWIQWRGRTARQDRPGQFHVVLNVKSKPFSDPQHKSLPKTLEGLKSEDAKVEMLLEIADNGIGERLNQFGAEQARGEKLNELTEKYYKRYPRMFEDPWPLEKYYDTDVILRRFLTKYVEKKPTEIRTLAQDELGIELSND